MAVLSYSAWQRRFGAEPSAIGQTLRIEGTPFTIVGVTPPDFFGVAVGVPVDVTIPLTMLPRLREDERQSVDEVRATRGCTSWAGCGRGCHSRRPTPHSRRSGRRSCLRPPPVSTRVSARATSRSRRASSPAPPGSRRFAASSATRCGCSSVWWACSSWRRARLLPTCCSRRPLGDGTSWRCALRSARGGGRLCSSSSWKACCWRLPAACWASCSRPGRQTCWCGLLSTSYESVVVNVAPDRRLFAFIALVVGVSTAVFTIAPIARASRLEPACMLDGGTRQTGSRPPRTRGASARCRAGRHLADPARGLGIVRAQSLAAARDRHRLRAREPVGGWRRRDVAGERTGTACDGRGPI